MTGIVPVDDTDDDDVWLDQLREAISAPPDAAVTDRIDDPARGDSSPVEHAPTSDGEGVAVPISDPSGLGAVRDDLRALGSRLASVESVVEDIARVVRRASEGPGPADLEQMIARVLQAELSRLLEEHLASLPAAPTTATVALDDETLDRWADRAERGEVPSGDVVILANELRTRISDLADLQRQALAELTADRKVLIDDAVREIRTMLFGR